ncbi:MAG: hypothetical protein P8Y44_03645 [Acidobacteriota bacterium]
MPGDSSLASLLREQAIAVETAVLDAAIQKAARRTLPLYLVGGAVRDLICGRWAHDLDFVVEGDATKLAESVAAELGAELKVHDRFATATVELEACHFDFASARRESYALPAALPVVEAGTLEQDLARRDFAVNAMAVQLWPGSREDLIDPFGGRDDLRAKTLRVLHPKSFVDDPTRILRGVRLEMKSDLRLSAEAVELANRAVDEGILDRLSGDRLRRELELLFTEATDLRAAASRLEELHILRALASRLSLSSTTFEWLERLSTVPAETTDSQSFGSDRWMSSLRVLSEGLDRSDRDFLARRLSIQGEARERLVDGVDRVCAIARQLAAPDLPPHRADELLRETNTEDRLLLLASRRSNVREWVEKWIRELRSIGLGITGEDLVRRGFEPGPRIGEALAATRRARLDGRIEEHGELAFALDYLASNRASSENGA